MTAAAILRSALDRLDGGNRWIKGRFRDGHKRCMQTALADAIGDAFHIADTEAHQILLAVVNEQFPERVAPLHKGRVTDFNDSPLTTWADVEMVFEKAIANAEERA